MQVPETDIYWTYSLLNASESRASAHTGTPAGSMAELVGIDGTNNGGLLPFPGFREVYRFAPENAPDSGSSPSVLNYAYRFSIANPYTNKAHLSRVVDFWAFSLVAGASTRVYGYVYVIRRPNNMATPSCVNTYDLMMDYYAPQSAGSAWSTIVLQQGMSDGGILADGGKAVMSVETTGKAVYVFRRGVSPIAVYFKTATGPTSTSATVVDPAGPGKKIAGSPYNGTADGAFNSSSSTHSLASLPDPTASPNPPCSFKVCSHNGTSGTKIASIPNITTSALLTAGSYSFALQLEDSRSGRKSQLSTNVDIVLSASRHVWVDGVYDSSRFDTLNVYRSVRTEGSAGVYTHGILQLEAQITLSSYVVTDANFPWASTPTGYGADSKNFRYAYQLKDAALVMQDVFLDKPSYSETMPKGGAGALLDGTMLVGNISESASDLTGTGETRWSASGADSPELFTAAGIYKPSNVGDAVTCFRRTGQIMSGFTRNGVQFFNKDNGFVRVLAAHQGYGITGPYAAATVGPVTYYLNYRGLKAVYPDGRLDDVQAINQVVSDEWYSGTTGAQELSKVSIAFDPSTLCLYLLNPTRQQAVQFWFATGVVSELQDMSFGKVSQGWWEDSDGQLVPRAMFLFNAPYPDAVTNTSYRPALYMPCRTYGDKKYPESNVGTQVSMFDANAVRNPSTAVSVSSHTYSYYDSTCTLKSSIAGSKITNLFDGTVSTAARLVGMWVYVLWPQADVTLDGNKARVIDADKDYLYLDREIQAPGKTIYVVLDPMYVKVMPAPLRTTDQKDEEFVVKQPSSLGLVMTDVAYTAGTNLAPYADYWVARVYRENETNSVLNAYPTNPDGTSVQHAIIRGDSPNWAAFGKHGILGQWFLPCVETFLANVKYRLVGLQVKGRMLPTDRTRRTY
jgi:hypothetical protein